MEGRSVVITGAGSGIGRAGAEGLAAAGYRLGLVDIDGGRLAETAALLGDAAVVSAVCDVADAAAADAAFRSMEAALGRVDILVNSAGIARYRPFAELTAEDWQRQIAVNLMGCVHMIGAVLPGMVARGGGLIVNIGSRRGLEPKRGTTAYSATKAGLWALSRGLAKEVGGAGVQVSYLAPGGTMTNLESPKDDRFLEAKAVGEAIVYMCEAYPKAWVRELTVLPPGL